MNKTPLSLPFNLADYSSVAVNTGLTLDTAVKGSRQQDELTVIETSLRQKHEEKP